MQQNQVRCKSSGQTEMTVAGIQLEGKSHHEKTKRKRDRQHKYPNTEGEKKREFKQSIKDRSVYKRGISDTVCKCVTGPKRPAPVRADSHRVCRAHAAHLPCSDNAVSFVKVRVVAGNIRTASPTV